MKQAQYSTQLPTNAATGIFTAVRIADKYTHRVPSIEDLRRDFGMSRATAYRWLRAIKDARGLA